MSQWSYIKGVIYVNPPGRTQPEKRYILDTVLDHLPLVTGSERNMNVYVTQPIGTNSSCSCDEFGMVTNNLVDIYGSYPYKDRNGSLHVQEKYLLTLDANLRDRTFQETKRDFMKWLTRLAKRMWIMEILVKVESLDGHMLIDDEMPYWNMMEPPSWTEESEGQPAWWEYLMWDRAKNSGLPMLLQYKYVNDPENDEEVERRLNYHRN